VFWLLIHIYFLIEFDSKLLVMIQWAWNYMTRKRGSRLMTGEESLAFAKGEYIDNGTDYAPTNNRQPVNV